MRDQEWTDWEATQGITPIADGTAQLCGHSRYIYWDRVQGVYVHDDDGSTCSETL